MTWRQCRCSVKSHSTYSIYLSETFWDCLVLMVRIYICRAARRSAVSYFSSDPNRSNTTSLQLCRNPIGREVDSEQEEVTLQSICSSQQQHTHTHRTVWDDMEKESFCLLLQPCVTSCCFNDWPELLWRILTWTYRYSNATASLLSKSSGSFGTKVIRKKHFILCDPGLCVTWNKNKRILKKSFS